MKFIVNDCEACVRALYEQVTELIEERDLTGEPLPCAPDEKIIVQCAKMAASVCGTEIEIKGIAGFEPTERLKSKIEEIVKSFQSGEKDNG